MRYRACLLIAFCATAVISHAANPSKLSSAKQEVVMVSKAWMEAALKRDLATWTRYVAEDCTFSTDEGPLLTQPQMLEHNRKLPALYDRSVNPRDHIVHLYGNPALINDRATTHERCGDTDSISEQRRTETLLKQNGSWLLIAIQWDNMPINFRKPVANDGKNYDDMLACMNFVLMMR